MLKYVQINQTIFERPPRESIQVEGEPTAKHISIRPILPGVEVWNDGIAGIYAARREAKARRQTRWIDQRHQPQSRGGDFEDEDVLYI